MTKKFPMPFNTDMMHAILDGRKTQTRRVMKAQPVPFKGGVYPGHVAKHAAPYIDAYCSEKKTASNPRGMSNEWCWWTKDDRCGPLVGKCPYIPGDLLWVRETWRTLQKWDCMAPRHLMDDIDNIDYAASGYMRNPLWVWGKNRPSMFMPRWASRLTLRITNVRAERLQDISESDAMAEGAPQYSSSTKIKRPFSPDWKGHYKRGFQAVWDACYGPEHWDANPWVWVYDFEVIRGNVDEVAA
ncbi:hypothetical protein [Komagataeibacter sp. SM21]|uniref:hypothetical protein n=1 Tax=Komagataeibacter sp. SM21 TaxID=3242899 RepID=UPI0035290677